MNRFAILRDLPIPPLKRAFLCPICNYAHIVPEQEYTDPFATHYCSNCKKSWSPYALSKIAIEIEILHKNYHGYLEETSRSRASFSFWVDTEDQIFHNYNLLLNKEIHFHNKQNIPFYVLVQDIKAEFLVPENPNQIKITIEGAKR